MNTPETKTCAKCQLPKMAVNFGKLGKRSNPNCKECHTSIKRQWQKKNPDKDRRYRRAIRLRRYGLTSQKFELLLKEQEGMCLICKTTEPEHPGFVVDHDHKTGKVRGILCGYCNSGIGLLKDDPEICQNARDYLRSKC